MRATNAAASRKRRKRTLEAAKGFRLRRSKLYRYAKDALEQAYTLRGEALQLDERVRHIEHQSPFEQNSELCRIDPRRPAVE